MWCQTCPYQSQCEVQENVGGHHEKNVVGSLVELRGVSDLKSRVYFGEEKARGTYDSSVSDLES